MKSLREKLERVRKALIDYYGLIEGTDLFEKVVSAVESEEHA